MADVGLILRSTAAGCSRSSRPADRPASLGTDQMEMLSGRRWRQHLITNKQDRLACANSDGGSQLPPPPSLLRKVSRREGGGQGAGGEGGGT